MTAGPAQERRRQQVLEVAARLAGEGYDAVRMKQVADESEVALATLYSWFAGKNLLILAVMAGWIDEMVERVGSESMKGGTPADRMEATLLRTIDLALEQPDLLRSCIRAFSSPDPMGIEIVGRIEFSFGQLLFSQMGDDIGFDRRLDVTRVVGGVWFAALMAWMCERRDEEHIREMLRSAVAVTLGRIDD